MNILKRVIHQTICLGVLCLASLQAQEIATHTSQKIYDSKKGAILSKKERQATKQLQRLSFDQMRLKNPVTQTIPKSIQEGEKAFAATLPVGTTTNNRLGRSISKNANNFSQWKNRGPFNIGGRTRAIAIDRSNEEILFAGGVTGGLWKSYDTGASWKRITANSVTKSISTIVQDPREGKEMIWYYGTGEGQTIGIDATGGSGETPYTGNGVYKSTDGGDTWNLLTATSDDDPSRIGEMDYVFGIVVHPITGALFVATNAGIFQSTDEGNSFSKVLPVTNFSIIELKVAPTSGRLYASVANRNRGKEYGWYTSLDGVTWEEITPSVLENPNSHGRTMIAVDPSREHIVYFFTFWKDKYMKPKSGLTNRLFRYNREATNADQWEDLSKKIPAKDRVLGINNTTLSGLNTQDGYNMVLEVHPTNPDIVLIGGVNLFRTLDGFKRRLADSKGDWIGGKSGIGNTNDPLRPHYPNHHVDQHNLVFFRSSPNRLLSANDGGVFITEDVSTNFTPKRPITWASLNNGFITSQAYGVSFDPEATDNYDLIAGFQDRGSWYSTSTEAIVPWQGILHNDGGHSAITNQGRTHYASRQVGDVVRFEYDEDGNLIAYGSVRPKTGGFLFITPFILDPNNTNQMYIPAGDVIYWNTNLDEVPLNNKAETTTEVNWVKLSNTQSPDLSKITALEMSTYPIQNRLYYGTETGKIFRLDQANIVSSEPVDIATGKGLPEGYVNNINVDPSDSDRVIVSFSNYGIPSLFLTINGGETWQNISGNLEAHEDGSGNGPSVRGSAFLGASIQDDQLPSRQLVYVATSTGLYYTNKLRGTKTRWIRENLRIGNTVVSQVRTRKDGFIAVATHGSGIYSAKLPIGVPLPTNTLKRDTSVTLEDITITKGELTDDTVTIDIDGIFYQSKGKQVQVSVKSDDEQVVSVRVEGNQLLIQGINTGTTRVVVRGMYGEEEIYAGFTVQVVYPSIYTQQTEPLETDFVTFVSQEAEDELFNSMAADDFIVPEGYIWSLSGVVAEGSFNLDEGLVNTARVIFYEDDQGKPGVEIYNTDNIKVDSPIDSSTLSISLPESITLMSGVYWISVQVIEPFERAYWTWNIFDGPLIGAETHVQETEEHLYYDAITWTPVRIALRDEENRSFDLLFQLFGEKRLAIQIKRSAVTEPKSSVGISPNPSTDNFVFHWNQIRPKTSMAENVTILIYDIMGKQVYEESGVATDVPFVWNTSSEQKGIYVVKIFNKTFNKSYKLIKR